MKGRGWLIARCIAATLLLAYGAFVLWANHVTNRFVGTWTTADGTRTLVIRADKTCILDGQAGDADPWAARGDNWGYVSVGRSGAPEHKSYLVKLGPSDTLLVAKSDTDENPETWVRPGKAVLKPASSTGKPAPPKVGNPPPPAGEQKRETYTTATTGEEALVGTWGTAVQSFTFRGDHTFTLRTAIESIDGTWSRPSPNRLTMTLNPNLVWEMEWAIRDEGRFLHWSNRRTAPTRQSMASYDKTMTRIGRGEGVQGIWANGRCSLTFRKDHTVEYQEKDSWTYHGRWEQNGNELQYTGAQPNLHCEFSLANRGRTLLLSNHWIELSGGENLGDLDLERQ